MAGSFGTMHISLVSPFNSEAFSAGVASSVFSGDPITGLAMFLGIPFLLVSKAEELYKKQQLASSVESQ